MLCNIIKKSLFEVKSFFILKDSVDYHWQWYKDFFSLNYIRYFATWFAAAPIFANLFNVSGSVTPICIQDDCIKIQMNLPFSWWILWIGSILFILAFGLYHAYCPPFIKRYSSYSDYLAARHSPRWAAWEAKSLVEDSLRHPNGYDLEKFVDRLSTKDFVKKEKMAQLTPNVVVETFQSVLRFEYEGETYKLGMPPIEVKSESDQKHVETAVHEVVWEIFGRRASSFKRIRFIITYLIRMAWFTVLLTIAQNIYSVIEYALTSL